ncbi:MAG: sigma 54-interacting transcriptional regulator [Proteobacteria bacterium]|nr:sigma 54-interacting transcriptional regulator [Pseudomonadota bacterium]
MITSNRSHSGLKYHTIIIAITGVFAIACLILSIQMPRLPFETSVQTGPSGNSVVVRRVFNQTEDIQYGDVIEAVGNRPVQSKAAFLNQLLFEDESVDLTIRRTGNLFQRPLMASDFAHGALPAGVRATDRPVLIADEDGNYSPLEGVDFDTLRSMLETRSGAVSVVFKRQEEIITTSIQLRNAAGRTFGISLILLVLGLMGVLAWKTANAPSRVSRMAVWTNLTTGLACVGVLALGLWNILGSVPIILMLGIVGLTLYKAVNLDYHLVNFSLGKRIEPWIRIALFAGPVATLIIPVWLCISEMPVLWGGNVNIDSELKYDTFAFLPMLWIVVYTMIDGGIIMARRKARLNHGVSVAEGSVLLACMLSIFVFALLRIDLMGAQWFLMAVMIVQCLGDILPILGKQQPLNPVRLDSEVFSMQRVRDILLRASEIVGSNWLIQIVIDRPAPKHVVALVESDDETALNGVAMNVLSNPWRDFLEVFRIEGGCITGERHERDGRDPVQGIADRLGIVIALPIADNVAGTTTNMTFLVSEQGEPNPANPPSINLSQKQKDELSALIDELTACGPALVYLSAEMSLDYVGDDLDEIMRKAQEAASYAHSMRTQTQPLNAHEIPHGLLDEDELDETYNDAPIVVKNPELGVDEFDTKVYEEEVLFLRSQVQALYSQQLREFSLSEIEFTESQQAALSDLKTLDPPIIFIGEPGTGKQLLALATHQARSEGPFLKIDAAEVPETIFALDMFGDGDEPGLIKSAAGGGLLIQNVDRLSDSLLNELLDAVQKLSAQSSIALYMSVNVASDAFSVSQYRLEPMRLPKYRRELATHCDAEIIVLDPLRTQDDLDIVAEYFRQKQAMRANRQVDAFSPEALLALKSYRWPGNFNELRSVVERAVMRCQTTMISVADLGRDFEELADASTKNLVGSDVFREQAQILQALTDNQQAQIERLNERIQQLELNGNSCESAVISDDAFLEGSYADIEKRLLNKILDKYQRDPEKAAQALELNKMRFFNKLSKYHLIKDSEQA